MPEDNQPTEQDFYLIPHMITKQTLQEFDFEVERFCQDKEIHFVTKGVSVIPISGGTGSGMLLPIPWCYIEYYGTKEQYQEFRNKKLII